MVTVTNVLKRTSKSGEDFIVLELSGGVSPTKSKNGKFYFSQKKCTVSTNINEQSAKKLIGSEFPGKIIKQECEPYVFITEDTQEEIQLSHRWEYVDDTLELIEDNVIPEEEVM